MNENIDGAYGRLFGDTMDGLRYWRIDHGLEYHITINPKRSKLRIFKTLKARSDELLLQTDDQDDSRSAVHDLHALDSLSDSHDRIHESESSFNVAAVHIIQPCDTLKIPGKSVITHCEICCCVRLGP